MTGNKTNDLYILIDLVNNRLIEGCEAPFEVHAFSVKTPNGKVFDTKNYWDPKIKIASAEDGEYKITADVVRKKSYHHYFTITTYSYKDTVKFNELHHN